MCLIAFAYRHHPSLPFVLTANRDEFHFRPTRSARFWTLEKPHPGLLAGQDLTKGGTWLGLSRDGRFAAVTNIRTPGASTGSKSRGLLTRDFLLGGQSPKDFLTALLPALNNYAGFNLLIGDRHSLYHLNSETGSMEQLAPGIYGLSNATLNSDWPKVQRSKAALQQLLDEQDQVSMEQLTSIMTDRQQAPADQLPDTGIPVEMEHLLSASFICNTQRDYGTRCTTSIVLDQHGNARFSEQNYDADGKISSRRLYQFGILEQAV